MKKILAWIIAGVVLFVLLFVVVLSGGDDELDCKAGGRSSSAVAGGVPDGEFSMPEAGGKEKITSGFGMRWGAMHQGLDIASGAGTPIYAFADGVVAQAGPASGFGQWIVLNHTIDGSQVSTVYGHIFPEDLLVKTGDEVKAGQHIANEGYNGGVDPPGPGGAHLHFEVWPGTRLGGGAPVDPQPWIDKAVEPGTGGSGSKSESKDKDKAKDATEAKSTDAATTSATPSTEPTPATGSEELKPDPRFSEANMQVDAVRVGRAGALNFPELEVIGGWRAIGGAANDHTEGRAVDLMIPNSTTGEGKELGDRVHDYFQAHAAEFNIDYIIWRQYIMFPDGSGYQMEDRGSPTDNHYDHVHISTETSAMATAGQDLGSGPVGGGASGSALAAGKSGRPCAGGAYSSVDKDLGSAEGIPEELRPWIEKAGSLCPAVSPALIAGLEKQESQFKPTAVSTAAASGYAQFTPETWADKGAKVDENGEVAGPPGSGSPSDPADATMAAGRYLCEIAKGQEPLIESGEISGDPTELMLAGYNAGPGSVRKAGGIPPYPETQHYVKIVPEYAKQFA